MRSFLLSFSILLLVLSCRSTAPVKAVQEPGEAVAPTTPLPPEVRTVEGGALSIENLAGRVVLRDRAFKGGSQPTFSIILENLQAESPLTVELATDFVRKTNPETTVRTEWVRVEIPPRKSHQYFAQGRTPADDARLLVREVTRQTP